MKALVTGGAGFIGSNLVDRLIEGGHQVMVWDDFSTGKEDNINEQAKRYRVDLGSSSILYPCDSEDFEVDVIFHLAAEARIQPSFDNLESVHDSNVTGTIQMLEWARQYKCRFVYAGSSTAYFDKFANPYALTKKMGEEYCELYNKLYGVPVAIARFFNVYGPRQIEDGPYATVLGIFEKQKRAGEKLTITGDGSQRRDFTHVDDICSGLIAMAGDVDWKAKVFNLGSGCNYSILDVAKMFNQEYGFIPARRGEAKETVADIAETMLQLSWRPERSDLELYVLDFLDDLRLQCNTH